MTCCDNMKQAMGDWVQLIEYDGTDYHLARCTAYDDNDDDISGEYSVPFNVCPWCRKELKENKK
jgi:hypothetical protein